MVSTKPLSGTRDFLSQDVLRRQYIVDVVEQVYQRYGFEPLETPAFERLSTLLGKYGEDEKLIFRILHRGQKLTDALEQGADEASLSEQALRYDLTVPLARVVAQYRQTLPRYYKRYQIQPVWRADRPGKGRYREFWQCDADVVGSHSMLVEADMLAAAADIYLRLGFDNFEVSINHRQILYGILEVTGVPADLESGALTAIDKLDKIGEAGVKAELLQRGVPEEAVNRLMPLLKAEGDDNDLRLEWLSEYLDQSERGLQGLAEVRDILRKSQTLSSADHLRFNPYLARGLSYYTGAIFEVSVPDFGSSLGGGGRYDGLIGMFSKQDIPSCGFSLGLDRVQLVMEERDLFPTDLGGPQLMVSIWQEDVIPQTLTLATDLRQAGLRVDVYPEPDRYGKQFRYAEERGIRFVLLLGEAELTANEVAVKDLQTGEQVSVARDQIAAYMIEQIG